MVPILGGTKEFNIQAPSGKVILNIRGFYNINIFFAFKYQIQQVHNLAALLP